MRQLREFAQQAAEFEKLNARLVAITVDGQEQTRQTWETHAGKQFTILSDPEAEVIRRYGLLHERGDQPPIAIRTTIIIDEEGIERWREAAATVSDYPPPEKVLERLRALQ